MANEKPNSPSLPIPLSAPPRVPVVDASSKKKTNTSWRAFEKLGLGPAEIVCQAYRHSPAERYHDGSCHTRLPLEITSLRVHALERDHGGRFQMTMREYARPWTGWANLEQSELECSDLRCEICDKILPFHPNYIREHMKPHAGKVKRIRPGGVFNFTITTSKPVSPDEAWEENT